MKLLKYFVLYLVCINISVTPCLSDKKFTAYFSNDSVNGLKISDAYETHNMGFKIDAEDNFYVLDFGIVSPDMHLYKNQFRKANRSFGELISFQVGKDLDDFENVKVSYYSKVTASGKFGIDKIQDSTHKLLNLRPVNYVNDMVRMPDRIWFGVGGNVAAPISDRFPSLDFIKVDAYAGTDRIEVSSSLEKITSFENFSFTSELGLRLIANDNIISSPPVYAEIRKIIPHLTFGLNFEYLGAKWYIRDKFSLPTIISDDSIYGVLSAGVVLELD